MRLEILFHKSRDGTCNHHNFLKNRLEITDMKLDERKETIEAKCVWYKDTSREMNIYKEFTKLT